MEHLSHNLPLRNLHDPHNRDIVHLAQTANEREGVQMLRLDVCQQNTWRNSKYSWRSTNVTRKLYFMTQTTHNSEKTATDNDDTMLARHRKEDAQDTAYPGCEHELRNLRGLQSRLDHGDWSLQHERDVDDASMNCIFGTTSFLLSLHHNGHFNNLQEQHLKSEGMH